MSHVPTERSRTSVGDLPFIDALEEPEDSGGSRRGSRRRSSIEQAQGRSGSRRPSRSTTKEDPVDGGRRASSRRSSSVDGGSRRPSRSPAPAPSPVGDAASTAQTPATLEVESSRDRRGSSAPGSRSGSRRSSRSPAPVLEKDPPALLTSGAEGSGEGTRPGSRRGSVAPGSRSGSRSNSRAYLDVDYYGGRRRSSSRRESQATDIAEVVLAELRRPTRRSSRALALELGEIVSVEVRRKSRAGSDGGSVEEVRTKVRRQSLASSGGRRRSSRPSLYTQPGSAFATSDEDGDADDSRDELDREDGDEDEESGSSASGTGQLDQGSRIPQYVATIVVNLASFCNGVTFGWPAIALPLLQSRMSPLEGSSLSDENASWLAATLALSAALSTPFWLMINDRYGRKNTGYLVGLAFGLHWIVLGVTRNLVCLYTARAIGGLGTAGCLAVCPTYVKEISEDSIRGTLGIIFTIMFNLGILVAYGVGAAVSYKGVNILGMSFVLLFVVLFWQVPESPVYLLSRGKNVRAARALQWLRGKSADVLDELSVLRRANRRRKQEGDASLFDIVSDKASFKGIVIAALLCSSQPMSGVPVVLSFTVSIFMEAGDSISPYMATIIVGTLLLISSYAASLVVERAGRKIMLLISHAGCAICLGVLGLYFYIKYLGISIESLRLGWLPVTSLSIYVIFVSLGITCLPFVVITEIFLPQAQRIASIVGFVIIWTFAFISMKFFTNIANAIGIFSCYWIFGAYCVVMCVFIHLYVPETKNRSLDSILDELSGDRKPLIIVEEKYKNNFRV